MKALTPAAKRLQRPALSPDDVLDAHEALERYDGDALALFAQGDKVRSSSTAS
jgi:hypothetical protein